MLIWLAAAIAILAGAGVLLVNRLIAARNRARAAWGDVDAELRRRADLVPELNAAVQAYAAHERTALEAATSARLEARGDDPVTRAAAEQRLGSAIGGVVGIAEANPELRASERFAQLSDALSQSEDRIARSRLVYNDTVQTYNTAIQALPASLVAGALGFRRREPFELGEARR